ncbi:hypothetical protein CDAR_552671 [Caerostris darwini]|uniref:Uncharacterized protein n=1 Tax=Caerostris darwini TaxID=1538125 RepID=A0AAV4RN18_9ARAC|nr:hypothetical protein CDAR_552671 [Caerostris darwini]
MLRDSPEIVLQARVAELVVTGGDLHGIPHGHPAYGAAQVLALVLDTESASVSGHSPATRGCWPPTEEPKVSGKKYHAENRSARAETAVRIITMCLREGNQKCPSAYFCAKMDS